MLVNKGQAHTLLKSSVGEDTAEFRAGQWEAIDALVNRQRRLLVVERTGWGKSNVYFIATRILRNLGHGPTVIVSPLLALMRNQLVAARRISVNAETINSSNTREENKATLDRWKDNQVDALLISPERLADDDFVTDGLLPVIDTLGLGLLVIDEAHCISDWGHDFRPDYRRLVNVVRRVPENLPILATTATANDRVVGDVAVQLGNMGIQRGNLIRETLALQTMTMPSSVERLAWLADHIEELPGTGIIYTLTRRDAEQVSEWLNKCNIFALPYYSGITAEGFRDSGSYRMYLEDQLLHNNVKALVATVALGMGYDKPDLGFVIHYQAPASIVAYYQQVGRAGRATDFAVGVLMTGSEDEDIHEYFRRSAFPEERWVRRILQTLGDYDGLTVRGLEGLLNLRNGQISDALKFLAVESPSPVVKDRSTWRRTPVPYQMDTAGIQRLTHQRELEWQEVQSYIEERGCLMEFLSRVLDDPDPQPCGKCEPCRGSPVISKSFTQESAVRAARFIRHSEFPLRCPVQVAQDSFPNYGFTGNMPLSLRARTGRILSRWGDASWGKVVAEDKKKGHFRDHLVDATVEMIMERWGPDPAPTWVTCVPSRLHPDLVPDFARRVAHALMLPFLPALTKVKDNEPQKLQQNRFHQCINLDGAFEVKMNIPSEPALLIDDIFNSGWTLTVTAALLLLSESGPVYPVALASTSS